MHHCFYFCRVRLIPLSFSRQQSAHTVIFICSNVSNRYAGNRLVFSISILTFAQYVVCADSRFHDDGAALQHYAHEDFFNSISKELEEAAEIDGATRFKTLFTIIVPLSKPGIMAIAIYTFLIAWDDFLFGLTLVSDIDKRTLSPGLSLTFLGEYSANWSGATAAAATATIPLLIAFMFLQRYMVEGLTAGGVKE